MATNTHTGAGIGGGQSGNGGTVTIYGGIVTATGGPGAAGIGGGSEGAGGSVTINGGTVIASGGSGAHGIGGSKTSSEKTGTLTVGSGLKVFGGDSANPTTVITEYSSTRKQYMIVVGSVSYVELSFNSTTGQVTSAEKTVQPGSYTLLTSSTNSWSAGSYVVNGSVTIASRISVSGTANLILTDGATLTASGGINVASGTTLNIYAQSGGTGALIATGGSDQAGIGGGNNQAGGTVTIHGGAVTATGSGGGAGIGGGYSEAGGTVEICGGNVTATGLDSGAEIGGGGYNGAGGTVTINGGTVTATGGRSSVQGIGYGAYASSSGELIVASGLKVFGGSSANPTTEIASPYDSRPQYMMVLNNVISFDGNATDATGSMPSYPLGSITLPANAFTRTGYTFKNWNTKADGSGDTYEVQDTATFTTATTLYAQWEVITYSITYDLQSGTVATANPTTYTVETATFTLTNPTKTGYDFAGWTGTDLSDTTQTVTIAQGSTGERSYTANFTPVTYTLTYELNGGTNASGNPSSYTVETATITLQAPTKTGYDFSGWTSDGQAITEITTGSTGDKTLTAVWTSSGTGEGSSSSINVEVGTPELSVTSNGDSRTSLKTVFTTSSGNAVLTADLAITTASEELKATVGTSFDTIVSVDVTLNLVDTAYTKYEYSVDITGLPDWLKVSG